MFENFPSMDGINVHVQGPCSDTIVVSLLGILEKITIWANSSSTSHDSIGFQLSPSGFEF